MGTEGSVKKTSGEIRSKDSAIRRAGTVAGSVYHRKLFFSRNLFSEWSKKWPRQSMQAPPSNQKRRLGLGLPFAQKRACRAREKGRRRVLSEKKYEADVTLNLLKKNVAEGEGKTPSDNRAKIAGGEGPKVLRRGKRELFRGKGAAFYLKGAP